MKTVLAWLAITGVSEEPPHSQPHDMHIAAVCFAKRSEESGMNRICYYDCLGSRAAITIPVTQLCPLTINN
jgi:hypothetical protein